jgi:hypothetical protein
MNADKILLPHFLIADLYKETLVDINDFSVNQQQLPEETLSAEHKVISHKELKYIRGNGKKITIVVNQPGTIHLNKEDLAFLSNILKACQLNTADIAIVNASQQQVTYSTIKEQLNARQILLFDIEPSVIGLPFRIPPFQVQNYDSCTIMLAPALSALNQQTQEGKLLKTKLWNSLRQVFGIG